MHEHTILLGLSSHTFWLIFLFCIGSCVDAGFTECCTEGECRAFAPNSSFFCFCDRLCFDFNDCCDDISQTNCTPKLNGKFNLFRIMYNAINIVYCIQIHWDQCYHTFLLTTLTE